MRYNIFWLMTGGLLCLACCGCDTKGGPLAKTTAIQKDDYFDLPEKTGARLLHENKNDSLIIVSAPALAHALATKNDDRASAFFMYTAKGYDGLRKEDSLFFYFRLAEQYAYKAHNNARVIAAQIDLVGRYYDFGKPDSVIVYKEKMLREEDTIRNPQLKMQLDRKLGDVYATSSEPKLAIQSYFKALEYVKNTTDSVNTGVTLMNIGFAYNRINDIRQSLSYSLQAIPYLNSYPYTQSVCYNDIGCYYSALNKYDTALLYIRKGIADAESINDTGHVYDSYLILCSTLVELKKYDEAEQYLKKISAAYRKTKYTNGLIPVLMQWGALENSRHNFQPAFGYYKQALAMAEDAVHADVLPEIYKNLSDIAGALGFFKDAWQYQLLRSSIVDSLSQESNKKNIAELETKYKTAGKEQEITSLNRQVAANQLLVKAKSRNQWLLLAAVLLVLLIAGLLYRSFLLKRKSNQLLEEKNAVLETANASKIKLFSIISHDLRAPVSSLFNLLTLQAHQAAGEQELPVQNTQIASLQTRVQQSAAHVLDAMEDILLWSKSQLEAFVPAKENVQLDELVKGVANIHQSMAAQKGITMIENCPADLFISTDPNLLKTVLRNLISNAVKYTPSGGQVTLEAAAQQGKILFRIKDTGPGMTPAQMAALFEWNSIRSSSSGFGLTLAKELVEKMEGSMQIQSLPESGTEVQVLLPA